MNDSERRSRWLYQWCRNGRIDKLLTDLVAVLKRKDAATVTATELSAELIGRYHAFTPYRCFQLLQRLKIEQIHRTFYVSDILEKIGGWEKEK